MSLASESSMTVAASDGYEQKWRAYALRRKTALVLTFGWLPAGGALFLFSRFWVHQPELFLTLIVTWLVGAIAAVWWAGEFRCPRCKRRFGALGNKRTIDPMRGLFDKICSNCKLAKFEQ